MVISDYLEIYREGGLTALNAALIGLDQVTLIFVLESLKEEGFVALKFSDPDIAGIRILGIVIEGP